MNLKQLIISLAELPTVSGFEKRSADSLRRLTQDCFDEIIQDPFGNFVMLKRCGNDDAPTLMLDAHFDEIGMLVSGIKDKGFLTVSAVGGLDTRIMPAAEVVVYGKETFPAVVVSTPPHLQQPGDEKKLPKVTDLLLDTGIANERLEKLAPVGTPVGFKPDYTELLGGCLVGKGFDNKACAATLVYAVSLLKDVSLDFDIALVLSAREETGAVGAAVAAHSLAPFAAIVVDVNLAKVPDAPKHRTVEFGAGPAVSLSPVINRTLTRSIIDFADKNSLKYQTVVEIRGTGTNADKLTAARDGIPTAVVSLPLKNMHSYSEVVSVDDAEDTAKLIAEFIKGGISEWAAEI